MTTTDEELYRLAEKAKPRSSMKTDMFVVSYDEYRELTSLRESVLQRFKSREPRVIERWAVIVAPDAFPPSVYAICSSDDEARKLMKTSSKTYLAKAVITEVVEDA